ncbi:arginase-like protein [Elsinoe australis]|uniref:Arginase-like protein n=1 Tax=Elsinoe australis TaxID=40998 RepID=A0A4U7AVH6_9PEZI|nr:arginase-like protein [Elsinoe australis]
MTERSENSQKAPSSITVVFSPYHVGLRDHRVGDGPNRIFQLGVVQDLEQLGLQVHFKEIDRVDDFEGEIGRSFEVLRRTSTAITEIRKAGSFPIVLSGNCMATVGVACGLDVEHPSFIYFDAHNDMDTPSTNTNGYLDAMGLSMLGGHSFHKLIATVPGYRPLKYDKFVFCGLRDIDEEQRDTTKEAGPVVIWGDIETKVDYPAELAKILDKSKYDSALVHLDLDVLDQSLGKVNGYESPGGMFEDEVMACMDMVPQKAEPVSLTVCSFNPNLGDGDKIGVIGVRAIVTFAKSLLQTGAIRLP